MDGWLGDAAGHEACWACSPWPLEAPKGVSGLPHLAPLWKFSDYPARKIDLPYRNLYNFGCSRFSVRSCHQLPAVFSVLLPCGFLISSIRRKFGQNPSYAILHQLKFSTAPDTPWALHQCLLIELDKIAVIVYL